MAKKATRKSRKSALDQQRANFNNPTMRALAAELIARRQHEHTIIEAIQAQLEIPSSDRGENSKGANVKVIREIIRDARAAMLRDLIVSEETGDGLSRDQAFAESVAFYEAVIRAPKHKLADKMRARKQLDNLYGLDKSKEKDGDDDRQDGQHWLDFLDAIRGGHMDPPPS